MSEMGFQSDYKWYPFSAKSTIEAGDLLESNIDIDSLPRSWVPVAKTGQVVKFEAALAVITEEGLKASVGSWKDGKIFDNHKTLRAGFKIYEDKYEQPYLYFLLDQVTCDHLEKGAGGSIDAISTRVEGNKILAMRGVGYSILSHNFIPSCTKEAGCGIPIAGAVDLADINTKWDFKKEDYTLEQLETACAWRNEAKPKDKRTKDDYQFALKLPDGRIVWDGVSAAMNALNGPPGDVNILTKDRKDIYNVLAAGYKLFGKEPPELMPVVEAGNEIKNKGGSIKKMADKVEIVDKADMYTKQQVSEITAAAVADVTERLDAISKVALTDLGTTHTDEVKKLSDEHATEMEKQRVAVQKQATLIESLSTQYSLSDEQKKSLMDAQTPEDALTLFSTLKVEKPGVIAAGTKAEKGDKKDETGGIIMGGAAEQKAATTMKVPELGNFDPYTGKFETSYREEPI